MKKCCEKMDFCSEITKIIQEPARMQICANAAGPRGAARAVHGIWTHPLRITALWNLFTNRVCSYACADADLCRRCGAPRCGKNSGARDGFAVTRGAARAVHGIWTHPLRHKEVRIISSGPSDPGNPAAGQARSYTVFVKFLQPQARPDGG